MTAPPLAPVIFVRLSDLSASCSRTEARCVARLLGAEVKTDPAKTLKLPPLCR
jgi:hypothetical protein